jgi:hypothetical protein
MEFEEQTEENYNELKKFYNDLDGNMQKIYLQHYKVKLDEKKMEYDEYLKKLYIAKEISSNYKFNPIKIDYIKLNEEMTWVNAMIYANNNKCRLPNYNEADIIKRMLQDDVCFWMIHTWEDFAFDSDNEVHKFDSKITFQVYLIELENQET